jgi:hypothetical protein
MTLLKLKAKIYQYTGIYLAQKEEDEYLRSEEAISLLENNEYEGLVIGLWQTKHGFVQFYCGDFKSKYNSLYKNVWIFIKVFYKQLKHDLKL